MTNNHSTNPPLDYSTNFPLDYSTNPLLDPSAIGFASGECRAGYLFL